MNTNQIQQNNNGPKIAPSNDLTPPDRIDTSESGITSPMPSRSIDVGSSNQSFLPGHPQEFNSSLEEWMQLSLDQQEEYKNALLHMYSPANSNEPVYVPQAFFDLLNSSWHAEKDVTDVMLRNTIQLPQELVNIMLRARRALLGDTPQHHRSLMNYAFLWALSRYVFVLQNCSFKDTDVQDIARQITVFCGVHNYYPIPPQPQSREIEMYSALHPIIALEIFRHYNNIALAQSAEVAIVATALTTLISGSVFMYYKIKPHIKNLTTLIQDGSDVARYTKAMLPSVTTQTRQTLTDVAQAAEATRLAGDSITTASGPVHNVFDLIWSNMDPAGKTAEVLHIAQVITCMYMMTRTTDTPVRVFMIATTLKSLPIAMTSLTKLVNMIGSPITAVLNTLHERWQGIAHAQPGTNTVYDAYKSLVSMFGNMFGHTGQIEVNTKAMQAVRTAIGLAKDTFTTIKAIFKFVLKTFSDAYLSATGKVLRIPGLDEKVGLAREWMAKVREIIILDQNPKQSIFLDQDKARNLIELEKQGSELASALMKANVRYGNWSEFTEMLKALRTHITFAKTSLVEAKSRRRPLFMVLSGLPGQGKTVLMTYLEHDIQNILHQKYPDIIPQFNNADVYNKKHGNADMMKFDDGYRNQSRVHIDDFGTSTEDEVTQGMYDWIIRAVNVDSCQLNMANIESKDTTYFNSSMVTMTTNHLYLKSPKTMTDINAVRSRIDLWINVKIKDELKAQNGKRGVNANAHEDPRQNWQFTLGEGQRAVPITYFDIVKLACVAYQQHQVDNQMAVNILKKQDFERGVPYPIEFEKVFDEPQDSRPSFTRTDIPEPHGFAQEPMANAQSGEASMPDLTDPYVGFSPDVKSSLENARDSTELVMALTLLKTPMTVVTQAVQAFALVHPPVKKKEPAPEEPVPDLQMPSGVVLETIDRQQRIWENGKKEFSLYTYRRDGTIIDSVGELVTDRTWEEIVDHYADAKAIGLPPVTKTVVDSHVVPKNLISIQNDEFREALAKDIAREQMYRSLEVLTTEQSKITSQEILTHLDGLPVPDTNYNKPYFDLYNGSTSTLDSTTISIDDSSHDVEIKQAAKTCYLSQDEKVKDEADALARSIIDVFDPTGEFPTDRTAWCDHLLSTKMSHMDHIDVLNAYQLKQITAGVDTTQVDNILAYFDATDPVKRCQHKGWYAVILEPAQFQKYLKNDPMLLGTYDRKLMAQGVKNIIDRIKAGDLYTLHDLRSVYAKTVLHAFHVQICDHAERDLRVPIMWFQHLPLFQKTIISPRAQAARHWNKLINKMSILQAYTVRFANVLYTAVQPVGVYLNRIYNHPIVSGIATSVAIFAGTYVCVGLFMWGALKFIQTFMLDSAQSKFITHKQQANIKPGAKPTMTRVGVAQAGRDMNAEALANNTVGANLYNMHTIAPTGRTFTVNLLFLKERTAITSKHQLIEAVAESGWTTKLYRNDQMVFESRLEDLEVYFNDAEDLAYITFPTSMRVHKDITRHLIPADQLPTTIKSSICMIRRSPTGEMFKAFAPHASVDSLRYHSQTHEFESPSGFRIPGFHNEAGYCGGIYIRYDTSSQFKILGMHVAGTPSHAQAIFLTKELACLPFAAFEGEAVGQSGHSSFVDSIIMPGEESNFKLTNLKFVGKVKPEWAHRCGRDSKIVESPIVGLVGPITKRPANLKNLPDGTDALLGALVKTNVPTARMTLEDVITLEDIMEIQFSRLRSIVTPKLLTWHQAINGDKDLGLEPINLKTSPGFPDSKMFKKHKTHKGGSYHLFTGEPGNYQMIPELQEYVEALEEEYIGMDDPTPLIYTFNMKDELRDKPVPRSIYASSKSGTILMRRYLGSFIANFMANRYGTFTAVGINPHSLEWNDLYQRMTLVSDRIPECTDLKNNDNTMPDDAIDVFNHCLINWHDTYNHLGRRTLSRLLIMNVLNNYRLIQDELYVSRGKNASGGLLTTIMNTFVDSSLNILAKIRWNEQQGKEIIYSDFIHYFSDGVNYGDDGLNVVDPDFSPPLKDLARVFNEVSGMEMTHWSKKPVDEWPAQDTWEDVQFLQRSFVKDEAGYYHGPLPVTTIYDILNYVNKDQDPDFATSQNCTVALFEAFHHGRGFYNEFKRKVMRACDTRGISHKIVFYSYDELHQKFLTGFNLTDVNAPPSLVARRYIGVGNNEIGEAQSGELITGNPLTMITETNHLLSFADDAPKEEANVPEVNRFDLYAATDPWSTPNVQSILGRPSTFHVKWTSDKLPSMLLERFSFPSRLFAENPIMSNIMRNYGMIRADIHVQIRTNSTIFNRGNVLVAWSPNIRQLQNDTFYDYFDDSKIEQTVCLSRLMNYPHVLISATDQKVIEFDIPFVANRNFIDTTIADPVNNVNFGVVELLVFNRLSNTETATTSMVITVTASMTNITLSAPMCDHTPYLAHPEKAVAQSGLQKEQGSVSKGGILSTGLDFVARTMPVLEAIPTYGSLIAATAPAVKKLAELASSKGWDKPTTVQLMHKQLVMNSDNDMLGTGADQTNKLAMSPYNAISTADGVFGPIPTVTDIAALKIKPGLVGKLTFTQAPDIVGNIFMTIPVTPAYCPVLKHTDVGTYGPWKGNWLANTTLSALCSMFTSWTGSMKYCLHICAPKVVTGKVRITWIPQRNDVSTTIPETGSNCLSTIVDFAGETMFTFSIPYNQASDWLPIMPADMSQDQTGTSPRYADFLASINGILYFSWASDISASGEASNAIIDFSLFQGGGEDLQLATPKPLWNKYYYTPGESRSTYPRYEYGMAQSGESSLNFIKVFESGFEPLNGGSTSRIVSGIENGESVTSLNTLCHRYEPQGITLLTGGTAPYPYNDIPLVVQTANPVVLNFHARSTGMINVTGYRSQHLMLYRLFKYARGSIRYKFRAIQQANPSGLVAATVSPTKMGASFSLTTGTPTDNAMNANGLIHVDQLIDVGGTNYPVQTNFNCSAVYFDLSKRNAIEIEAPFFQNCPFWESRTDTYDEYRASYPLLFRADAVGGNIILAQSLAFGDDWAFAYPTIPDMCVTIADNVTPIVTKTNMKKLVRENHTSPAPVRL